MPIKYLVLAIADSEISRFMKEENIDFDIHNSCFGKSVPSPGLLIGSLGREISNELAESIELLAQNTSNIIAIYYGLERGDDLHEQWTKIYDYRFKKPSEQCKYDYEGFGNNSDVLSKIWEHFGDSYALLSKELSWLVWSDT